MKENGVREDDPEFQQARQFLSAISRENNLRKAQRSYNENVARQHQHQAQQQSQQQQIPNGHVAVNGAAAVNGVNGKCRPTPSQCLKIPNHI
jgi:hypothetical protein